jgi:transposase
MSRQGKYPSELRERAVRLVLEHQHEHDSQCEAICSVAEKFGRRLRRCASGFVEPRSTAVPDPG